MIAERLRKYPLVFVDDLDAPVLAAGDVAHLTRSLRFGVGDAVNVGDGRGRWAPVRLTSADGDVELTGAPVAESAPSTRLGVGFVPTKGVRPESVVHKLTELGIQEISILRSERSVVTFDAAKSERLLRKLATTVREACLQCRQPFVPEIVGVLRLGDFLDRDGDTALCDPDGSSLGSVVSPDQSALSVAVGPEGGWSPTERSSASLVALPGRVLRAETAAIAAGVVLAAHGEIGSVEK